MAVIKVFDSVGVKTLDMMGNLLDQDYDIDEEINNVAEETDDGF